MAIQVTLEDHTGNISHTAKMVENVPVQRLIPAVVTSLGLPITDPAGRPITYRLSHNSRQLQEDETLESAGVAGGDVVTIVPEMTAGGDQSGCVVNEFVIPLVSLISPAREWWPSPGFPQQSRVKSNKETVQARIFPEALSTVWQQSQKQRQCEVGGLLLGNVFQEGERFLIWVEAVLPAHHTLGSPASLTFTGATWLDLLKRRQQLPELATVGWYHSHPGLGVFFSGRDEFVHAAFFGTRPWYVALVVDPSSRQSSFFVWQQGQLVSRSVELLV